MGPIIGRIQINEIIMSEKLENNNKFNFKDKALTLEENIEIHLFS
jgi:hypothetical protein